MQQHITHETKRQGLILVAEASLALEAFIFLIRLICSI